MPAIAMFPGVATIATAAPTSTSLAFQSTFMTHASAYVATPSSFTVQPTKIAAPDAPQQENNINELLAPYLVKKFNVTIPGFVCNTNLNACHFKVSLLSTIDTEEHRLRAMAHVQCHEDFRSCLGLEPEPALPSLPKHKEIKKQTDTADVVLEPGHVLPSPPQAEDLKQHEHAVDIVFQPGAVLPALPQRKETKQAHRVPDAIAHTLVKRATPAIVTESHGPSTAPAPPSDAKAANAALSGASFAIATPTPDQAVEFETPDDEAQAGASFGVGPEETMNLPYDEPEEKKNMMPAEPGRLAALIGGFGDRKGATGATPVENPAKQPVFTCPTYCGADKTTVVDGVLHYDCRCS